MSLSSSALALGKRMRMRSMPTCLSNRAQRSMGHTVRVILKEDLPNGKSYKGEVLHVKAGYARNHLIPGKYALYATEENFERLDVKDPEKETDEQRAERLAREALSEEGAAELKAADLLKHYLRNKEVIIYRKFNAETQLTDPGMVDKKALIQKLSKQLKIDLESHENVHLRDELVEPEDSTPEKLLAVVEGMDVTEPCQVQIRQLGHYVARISLSGGYAVPLKLAVVASP